MPHPRYNRYSRHISLAFFSILVSLILIQPTHADSHTPSYSASEDGFEHQSDTPTTHYLDMHSRYTIESLTAWQRPAGPLRVGIQSGHLESENVPDEQPGIRRNKTGAKYKKIIERNVNYKVALEVKKILEQEKIYNQQTITVDIIPATVPPGYVADAFVSIHADGNPNPNKRGFKLASPRRDYGGQSTALESALHTAYAAATQLPEDARATTNMRGYYAFNWQRYLHAVHPLTPSAIIEIGFVTNAADRDVIVAKPEVVARGIADGILAFLKQKSSPLSHLTPSQQTSPISQPLKTFTARGKPVCLNDHLYGSIKTPKCVYGIETSDARQYALDLSASSLPPSRLLTASAVNIFGAYTPIHTQKKEKWYQYDIDGVVRVNSLQ